MSFVTTKQAKSITVPGVVKGLDNVLLASQWLMGPGGLPTAAAMGKFAAWRIIKIFNLTQNQDSYGSLYFYRKKL